MITHDKMVEKKMVTEQGYGCVLVGVRGGLESKFGQRPGHLGQVGVGLVLLVPGIQVGHVFEVPS